MKRVEIVKGRGRLYFDPATQFIRMDHAGSGPAMELSGDELAELSLALWYAAPIEARSAATAKLGAARRAKAG